MLAVAAGPSKAQPPCETQSPVLFGLQGWDSARFHTAVASYILRHGYGCTVQTVALEGARDSLDALAKGTIDVAMEVWVDNAVNAWVSLQHRGLIIDLGVNFADAVQGWYVPRYLIEGDSKRGIAARAPDLHSVFDLVRYKTVFADPATPNQGVFWNCAQTWACAAINTKKLSDYGLAVHFHNVIPQSGSELEEKIRARYEKGLPFLTYYWGPTWVLGSYDLVQLKEPSFDEARWFGFLVEDRLETATAYPNASIHKAGTFSLEVEAPNLSRFLQRYTFSTEALSDLLAYGHKHGLGMNELARHFLATDTGVWRRWMPEQRAGWVLDALEKGAP